MKGRPKVQRTNFRDFGHFGPFLTFLTDDLSPFLIKFWSFLVILVGWGSGRGRDDWWRDPAKGSSGPGMVWGGVRDRGREGSGVGF